jgi:hypothetical protein
LLSAIAILSAPTKMRWEACAALLAIAGTTAIAGRASADGQVIATQPGGMVTLEVGDALSVARIDREGVLSPEVRLRQTGSRFEGRVGRQKIAMVMQENRLTGKVGERQVSLAATRSGGVLSISGSFGLRVIALSVSLRSVEGQVGACQYSLVFSRDAYRGWVGCGGRPEKVRLAIPASLGTRSDVEIAALITPLLLL